MISIYLHSGALRPFAARELCTVRADNQRRLSLAGDFLAHNDQLLDLLESNMQRVEFNRYNLEVYLSIAGLYRQNLVMLQDLGRISDALKMAEAAAARSEAGKGRISTRSGHKHRREYSPAPQPSSARRHGYVV